MRTPHPGGPDRPAFGKSVGGPQLHSMPTNAVIYKAGAPRPFRPSPGRAPTRGESCWGNLSSTRGPLPLPLTLISVLSHSPLSRTIVTRWGASKSATVCGIIQNCMDSQSSNRHAGMCHFYNRMTFQCSNICFFKIIRGEIGSC